MSQFINLVKSLEKNDSINILTKDCRNLTVYTYRGDNDEDFDFCNEKIMAYDCEGDAHWIDINNIEEIIC